MRNKLMICLTTGLLLALLAIPAWAATYSYVNSVEIQINNKEAKLNNLAITMDQPAFIKNDRTLVPFRFLAEALGADVSWDNNTNTAGLTFNERDVKVTIGSKIARINGSIETLDVPAEIKGGRTFIPLRFVSEALGADVDYDEETETITVMLINTKGWKSFNDPIGGNLIYPQDWTIRGNLNSVLELKGPNACEITAQMSTGLVSELAAKQLANYTQQGYQEIVSNPLDPANPENGVVMGLIKPVLKDPVKTESILLVISKWEKGTSIYTVKGMAKDMDINSLLFDKIFLSEEDFEKWQSHQE